MSFFENRFKIDSGAGDTWVKVNCPFHSDTVASAGVNVQKGKFHCFTCDVMYNEIEFLSKSNGISEADAVMLLEASLESSPEQWRSIKTQLFADTNFVELVRNYFNITNDFIDKMDLGIKIWKNVPMLTFPVFYNGIRLGGSNYNLTKSPDVPKVVIDKGTEAGLVIPFDIWKEDKRKTYLVEGEKDMLAARAFGLNAITITGGAMASLHELSIPEFKGRDVVVMYDNDDAGRKGALKKYNELKNIAGSIKYIDISGVVEQEKEDFFDAVHKYGMEMFMFELLPELDFKEEEAERELRYTTLADAIDKNIVGQRLTTKITVPAEYADIYLSRTSVMFEKEDVDQTSPEYKKDWNMIPVGFKKIWRLRKSDPKELLDMIEVKATDGEIYGMLRAKLGIPKNEQFMKTTDLTTDNIYKSRITDANTDANFDEDEMENFTIDVYSFDKLNVGEEYIIDYILYPHSKRNQKLVAIAIKATHTSTVKNFEPNDEYLNEFRSNKSIDEHLEYLYQSARHHVAKHLDKNIWLMNELVFNSLYEFEYAGRTWHGTLDVGIIGDPRSGKSETSERLTQLYSFGNFVNLKTSSVVGLTAGSNKVDGTWLNTIGVLPRNHRRLVVMEELSGAAPEFVKTMTDVRSSGRMRLARAAGQLDVPCRLRMITISNPVSSLNGEAKSLSMFPNGVQPISELIKASEDVARYDGFLLVPAPSYRHDPNKVKLEGYKIPEEAYKHKADFTYTRTKENIKYEDDTVESYIWDKAMELNEKFESSFTLFGTTTYLKLARFAVAMANLTMSIDDDYNVVVGKKHVDAVFNFFIKIYDNDVFKLNDYKMEWQSYNEATEKDIKIVQSLYAGNSVLLGHLENVSEISRKNLQLISGLDNDGFTTIFSRLVAGKFIKLSGETVIPTGKLRQALKALSRDFKADLMLVDLDSKPEIIDF